MWKPNNFTDAYTEIMSSLGLPIDSLPCDSPDHYIKAYKSQPKSFRLCTKTTRGFCKVYHQREFVVGGGISRGEWCINCGKCGVVN